MTLQEFIKHSEKKLFKLKLFEELPIKANTTEYYIDALREVVSLVNRFQEKKFILSDEKVTRVK
jgi:hypothetical protein